MNRRVLVAAVAAAVLSATPARGQSKTRWTVGDEARMAAETASWAPPDFKRQLAKHSRRLMQGVADAAAAGQGTPGSAAQREAAARGARNLAAAIRRHEPFDAIAYAAGAIVHAVATAYAPAAFGASGPSSFLGFPAEPFAAPETLAAAKLPAATDEARRAAAITLGARLLAWTWKTAGGDASFVSQYPESKGPYSP